MIDIFLFLIIQGCIINGVHIAFKGYKDESGKLHGNIFYLLFAHRWDGNAWWHKPLYSCVKCMASLWGAITFWPTALYVYDFYWQLIIVFIFDVFALAYINFFLYKLT